MNVTLPSETGRWLPFLRKQLSVIAHIAVIYIAVLNVGFDMSIANTTLGMPSFRKYFGYDSEPGIYKISSIYQSGWTRWHCSRLGHHPRGPVG
jgi:hypothetical protein